MAEDRKSGGTGGGINEAALAGRTEAEPGDDSSMGTDHPSGGLLSGGAGTTAGLLDDHIAAEAGALGSQDGALADEAAARRDPQSPIGRTGGEAIGGGSGRGETGSGTPPDRGDLGGGGA
jgi:hypothetical protein